MSYSYLRWVHRTLNHFDPRLFDLSSRLCRFSRRTSFMLLEFDI
ncbi:MFS domain-containing protein [Psidium guajava]|nr:MFS domain-containing protein [Psidium guajava]